MKVYVASGSDEREFAAEYMRRLKSAGIELTLDWTEEIAKNGRCCESGTHGEAEEERFASGRICRRGRGSVLADSSKGS